MKKIVCVFPGQGSQAIGMGKAFVDAFDQARTMLGEASEALGYDLGKLLFEEGDKLSQTEFTQPAILFTGLMAYKLFESEMPIKPLCALGHSLGELTAASAMGAMTLTDAVKVASKRGELMKKACDGAGAGMMVTLGLADETAEKLCEEARSSGKMVWTANYNCDGQIVIAGLRADLETLVEPAKAAGAKRAMLLDMSVASHCPLLKSAQEPLKNLLNEKLNSSLLSPVIANANAKPYQTKAEAIELLGDQLTKPVLYKQSIKSVEDEADLFIEFGFGTVLKGLNKKITAKETLSVTNAEELESAIAYLEGKE